MRSAQPEEIILNGDRSSLRLVYVEGAFEITSSLLWKHCRSASAVRAQINLAEREPPSGLQITGLEMIGLYGVNVSFSDGNSRGIYPWTLLKSLAVNSPIDTNTPLPNITTEA